MGKAVKLIKILLLVTLAVINLFFLYHSLRKIVYPFEFDPSEGFVLNASRLFAQGEPLYYNNPTINFHKLTTLYPPLYYVLTGSWIKFFGISFLGGRLISFLSIFLSAVLVLFILLRLTKDRFLSILLSLMFPLLLPISCCSQYMRVDSLGLLLSLLALSLIIANKKLLFFLSPIVLVLAFFTKFNFALLIVPVFVMMIISKKTKWLLYFLEFALLSAVTFFWLHSTTQGAFFNDTFVYIGSSPYSLSTALKFMVNITVSYSFISLAFTGFLFEKKKLFENEKELLIFLCLLTEIPYLLFAMGKLGSSHNQFFQLSALVLLALGIIYGKSKDSWEGLGAKIGSLILFTVPLFLAWLVSYYLLKEMYPQLLLLLASAVYILAISVKFKLNKTAVNFCLAILLVAQVSVLYFKPLGISKDNIYPGSILKSRELNKEYFLKIIEIFKKNPGPALTYWTGSLVLSGKDSVFEAFVLNSMLNAGLFNTEQFYADISQKKYSVIIMRSEFATLRDFGEEARTSNDNNSIFTRRDFIQVVMENYKVGGKVGSAEILYPKTSDTFMPRQE